MRISLWLDQADPSKPICCPLGHPVVLAAIPGLVEVIHWMRDIVHTSVLSS